MLDNKSADDTRIKVNNLSKYESASKRFRVAYRNYKEYEETVILETITMFNSLKDVGYSPTEAIKKMAADHQDLKGFSQSSIYRHLPKELKGSTGRPEKNEFIKKPIFDKLGKPNQATLQSGKTVEEIVNKHPPKQTVVEQEKEERWKFNALNWQQKKRSLGDVPVSDTKIEWKVVKNTGNLTEEEAKEAMDIVTSAMKPPQPLQFTLSIKVVDSRTWSQAIGQARYLNEPIILIPNKQGELNLKV